MFLNNQAKHTHLHVNFCIIFTWFLAGIRFHIEWTVCDFLVVVQFHNCPFQKYGMDERSRRRPSVSLNSISKLEFQLNSRKIHFSHLLILFSAEPIFVFKLVIIFIGQRLNDYCMLVENPKFNSSNVRLFAKQKTRNDNWLLSEINLQTKKSTLASVNGSNFCIHVAR